MAIAASAKVSVIPEALTSAAGKKQPKYTFSAREQIEFMQGGGASPFGLEYYDMPTTDILLARPKTTKMVKDSIMFFLDAQAKRKAWVPAPNKYPIDYDWKNPPELRKKGEFSKLAKTTFTEKIFKDPKVKLWPGPGSYKPAKSEFERPGKKVNGERSERICGFVSDAMYLST